MDPIAVTAALLRRQLPDVPIREGASMMARVASRGQTHAVIVIAGVPITAKLPPEIAAGATLRLRVKEVTAERVWMQIESDEPQSGGDAGPARPPVPKPPVSSGAYAPPIRLPGAPAQPSVPGQPAQPSGTAQPGQPSAPGQPAQPGGTATPGQPAQPGGSTAAPGQPAQPGGSAAAPGQPAQPGGAAASGQPAQPGGSTAAPGQPAQPGGGTAAPGQPAQPGGNAGSTQPPVPGQPAQPGAAAPAHSPVPAAPGQPGGTAAPAQSPAPQADGTAPPPETAQPAQVAQPQPQVLGQPAPQLLFPPRVEVEEPPGRRAGADGEPADVVSLTFTSPTLGKLDLRLELRGEHLLAEVTTPAGRPHQVASGASERLRANLEGIGLEATVNVRPRQTSLDLYA